MPRITHEERQRFHAYLDFAIDKMNEPKNAVKQHWSTYCKKALFKLLEVEMHELDYAIEFEGTYETNRECFDIINFAMMIIDNGKVGE